MDNINEERRNKALELIRQKDLLKATNHEKSFIKSEDSDLIQKRMGADLFKGGMS